MVLRVLLHLLFYHGPQHTHCWLSSAYVTGNLPSPLWLFWGYYQSVKIPSVNRVPWRLAWSKLRGRIRITGFSLFGMEWVYDLVCSFGETCLHEQDALLNQQRKVNCKTCWSPIVVSESPLFFISEAQSSYTLNLSPSPRWTKDSKENGPTGSKGMCCLFWAHLQRALFFLMKKMSQVTREMAQWVKCFLCKYKEKTWVQIPCTMPSVSMPVCNPGSGRWRQEDPGVCWVASLAKWRSPGLMRDCLKSL